MDNEERSQALQSLRNQLSDASARRTAVLNELYHLAGRLPEIRTAFGNPFFYSHPENVGESSAQYTGASSHDVLVPSILALRRIERELQQIREGLQALGA